MTSAGQDMSGSGEFASVTIDKANEELTEQRTRRVFRSIALTAALVTLAVLLIAMGAVVWTFVSEFRSLALDAQVQVAAAPHATAPIAAASSAIAPAPRILVSLSAFTTAIAALVTALVVAATVLAIALVRASFTLTARGDDAGKPAADAGDEASVTLPMAEFVKAFGESLQTALKGVQGLGRT